jgi:hypothetical protein
MNKLALRIDELTVESFPTSQADGEPGTVQATRWYLRPRTRPARGRG